MNTKNKAFFLDRDGVINRELGDYVTKLSDFEILPHAIQAMKKFQEAGYLLIIITNQAGIAKGLYSHETLNEIHNYLKKTLKKEGIKITEIYYCPHHPDFNGKCLCRKSGSIMIEKAITKFNISAKDSFLIGDKARDIEAGEKVGLKGLLIDSNENYLNSRLIFPFL